MDVPEVLESWQVSAKRLNDLSSPRTSTIGSPKSRPEVRNQLPLALFLGRRGDVNEALNICKPPWADPRTAEVVVVSCITILFGSDDAPRTPESAQIEQVAGWLEQAIASRHRTSNGQIPSTFVGLGNLRERQGRYPDAKKLYLRAAEDDRDGISLQQPCVVGRAQRR